MPTTQPLNDLETVNPGWRDKINEIIAWKNDNNATVVPVGGIIDWYGNVNDSTLFDVNGVGKINTEMEKFAQCNGQGLSSSMLKDFDGSAKSTTPDLRNRFTLGKSDTLTLSITGGQENVTLTASQSGLRQHQHGTFSDDQSISYASGTSPGTSPGTANNLSSGVVNVDGVVGLNGGQAAIDSHTNMPPFMVVAKLIRYK